MRLFSVVVLVMLVAAQARAQVTVSVPGAKKRSIAVSGFSGSGAAAGQASEVLKNDLRLSGGFQLTPESAAEFVQQGSVSVAGGQGTVTCTVSARATKEVVLTKSYTGPEQSLRQMVHKLADDIVQKITGERGIAQTRIAFVWSHAGVKELAAMDYDGHGARQLTSDKSISVHPRWSPNGNKILYTSYRSVYPDVLEVDLLTGRRRRLAAFPGLNTGAVFSPDGLAIALTLSKDGNPELYAMDANGGSLRRLTRTTGTESSPCWSSDGQTIAYCSDDRGSPQVYTISKDGGEPTRLTVSPAYNTEPDWSRPPAGSKLTPMIAVTSRVGGRFQIGVYDSGTREVKPLAADDADNQDPSWAHDGRHLVFTKTRHWRSQLYLLDVLTSEQIALPAIEGNASEPAWGP